MQLKVNQREGNAHFWAVGHDNTTSSQIAVRGERKRLTEAVDSAVPVHTIAEAVFCSAGVVICHCRPHSMAVPV